MVRKNLGFGNIITPHQDLQTAKHVADYVGKNLMVHVPVEFYSLKNDVFFVHLLCKKTYQ